MVEAVAITSPATAFFDSARLANVYGQIDALLNAAGDSDCLPPITPALETMEPSELGELAAELQHAVAVNAPWAKDCLAYLEDLLGLTGAP